MGEVPEYYYTRVNLTREQEVDLVTFAKIGNRDAMEALIKANLSLVTYLAKEKKQQNNLEILNYGVMGLLIALEKFEVERGYRFTTFARHWVTQKIIEGLQIQNNIHRMGHAVRQRVIAQNLMSPVDVEDNLFDKLLPVNPSVEKDLMKIQMKGAVKEALGTLEEREIDIVVKHVMNESCTLKELGVEYGITRERIRQIEERALERLRTKLRKFKDMADPEEDN
jgi:RNA polymerase sigma factor (sigma-70 family)